MYKSGHQGEIIGLKVTENLRKGQFSKGFFKKYTVEPIFEKEYVGKGLTGLFRIIKEEMKITDTNKTYPVERQVEYWASRGIKITAKGSEDFINAIRDAEERGKSR